MKTPAMTRAQASLELALWHADAEAVSSSDLYIWLRESGFPSEIAIRLKQLGDLTAKVGAKAINLGKILLIKLIEFVKAHPNLAVGIALGAAVSSLIASIPFLGPILAPIALPLGIVVGAVAGHRLDKANGHSSDGDFGFISVTQDVIEVTREFFKLFIDTIRAVMDEIVI